MLTHEDDGMMGQFIVQYQEEDTAISIKELQNENRITIFPNPSHGNNVKIQSNGEIIKKVSIYNTIGALLYSNSFNKATIEFPLEKNIQGVLKVVIETANGKYFKMLYKR